MGAPSSFRGKRSPCSCMSTADASPSPSRGQKGRLSNRVCTPYCMVLPVQAQPTRFNTQLSIQQMHRRGLHRDQATSPATLAMLVSKRSCAIHHNFPFEPVHVDSSQRAVETCMALARNTSRPDPRRQSCSSEAVHSISYKLLKAAPRARLANIKFPLQRLWQLASCGSTS